jgi:methylenetetrahydrofolate reductase (NADPH)
VRRRTPLAIPFNFRPIRLAKKVEAGCDFIQTQCIYNMPKMREYMKRVVDMGLHEKCYILAGSHPHEERGYGTLHGQVRARHGRAR